MPLECYTLCLEEDCSLIWKKINTGVKSLLYVYMLSHEYILMLFVAEWKEVKKNNCGFHLPGISTSGMADKVIQSNYNIKNNYEKWKNKLKNICLEALWANKVVKNLSQDLDEKGNLEG